MPRGSKPGERRGGRQKGTPNKKTVLRNAAICAAAADPNTSPLDFLLTLMRDQSLPLETRVVVAQQALPYVHAKPQELVARQANPGRYSDRYQGESGWAGLRSIELKIYRAASEAPRRECQSTETPLGFLLGVMRNADTPPRLRLRVASIVAPYLHPKRGGGDAVKIVVEDPTGFAIDPALAMELRDAIRRREYLDATSFSHRENYEKEAPKVENRIREIRETLECPCPSKYKEEEQLSSDKERLRQLKRVRHAGRKLTKEEDVEEAHLTARVESWSTTPEHDARKRLDRLEKQSEEYERKGRGEPLTTRERNLLRLFRFVYPKVPADMNSPLVRAHVAIKPAAYEQVFNDVTLVDDRKY